MSDDTPVFGFTVRRWSAIIYADCPVRAAVIDFEALTDSDIVTNQFPGLTFQNTIVLTAGISLNEVEFPPHSGVNVVSDNGGPITIAFATPILSFGGYFTYQSMLTVAAFGTSSSQVDSSVSHFSSNDAIFGDVGSSPNEFLKVSYAGGISSVTITGDQSGGSFVMDDITTVPEPDSTFLFLTGGVGLLALRKKRR